MALRVAINGFGRIGRLIFRQAFRDPAFDIVAVNDITDAGTLAHLLKYDSVHGRLDADVQLTDDGFVAGDEAVKVTAIPDPSQLPWKELGIDLVLEGTGRFTKGEQAKAHVDAGARWVVITAPAKGVDVTVVYGVNHHQLDPAKHTVVSNGSCTTNCLAPVVKVLLDTCGIEHGLLTTIHAYTNDQRILDLPHKDLRRARAAALSMIPTTTGAAKAIGLVMPEMKGKLDGYAMRVPTPDVSATDLVVETEKKVTKEAVVEAFKKASDKGDFKGIMLATEEPLVSTDYIGCTYSSIVDLAMTYVVGDNMLKTLSWYDNEYGYSCRAADMIALIANKL